MARPRSAKAAEVVPGPRGRGQRRRSRLQLPAALAALALGTLGALLAHPWGGPGGAGLPSSLRRHRRDTDLQEPRQPARSILSVLYGTRGAVTLNPNVQRLGEGHGRGVEGVDSRPSGIAVRPEPVGAAAGKGVSMRRKRPSAAAVKDPQLRKAATLVEDSADLSAGGKDEDVRYEIVKPQDLKAALARMKRPEDPVVGTISNLAFKDMLVNWYRNVERAGMAGNALVGALDLPTFEFCATQGIPTLLLHSRLPSTDFRKNGKVFKEMGVLKTAFIQCVLEAGRDLIMSDTDTVWIRDPSDFFRASAPLGAADVMVTSDSVSHENDVRSQKRNWRERTGWDVQEWFRDATTRAKEIFGNAYEHAFNTGVLFLRSTVATRNFTLEWHHAMRTKGASRNWTRVWGDQHAFNELNRIRMFPIQVYEPSDGSPVNNRIFWTFDKSVKLGILPIAEFCNGHVFFIQKLPTRAGLMPYVVHNTFQFYFGLGKVARFRQEGLWLVDPPEYYKDGRFVSMEVELPRQILDMPPGVEKHEAAISHYYEAIRNGLAIAKILKRKLIFPRTQCFCDRFWFTETEPCRAPGVDVDPPYECPLDHLVDVGAWGALGTGLPYRQSNFLESPRVPDAIRKSRVDVIAGAADTDASSLLLKKTASAVGASSQDAVPEQAAHLPLWASDEDVLRLLGPGSSVAEVGVLHLRDPLRSFCRYSSPADNQRFDDSTYNFFRIEWCCLPEIKPHRGVNISVLPLEARTIDTCKSLILTQ